ncbi:MAG: cytochrome d ubiquinol oxidase subunit II [Bacteroidota bacterium]
MVTELIILVMAVSLLLYTLLGGADFGAGIIELFVGDQAKDTIFRAIAPVWEANHIWLIIALVILFNGFPEAYAIFSNALHIPILLVLMGIIARGAAFTFRHYDAVQEAGSQRIYTQIFRWSSVFTVFMLGMLIAGLFAGTIPVGEPADFKAYFLDSWFHGFGASVGLFLTVLSAYIAAIFLLGEVETENGYSILQIFVRKLFIASVASGGVIFLASWVQGLTFHGLFFRNPISMGAAFMATLLAPYMFRLITDRKIWRMRIVAGAQVVLILLGWLVIQWPALVRFADGSSLTIYEASAPLATMQILLGALVFGVCTIFPALYYLFRVFKSDIRLNEE